MPRKTLPSLVSISPARTRSLLARIRRLRVLVVGDVMLDHYLWGDASRISPEAPVPVVDVERESWAAGGAANVALNLSELGARCTVAGFMGGDEAGIRLAGLLRANGIEPIATPGSGSTIVKTRVLVRHQQLCRLDRESPPSAYALPEVSIERLLGKAIRAADAIILSDYAKGVLTDGLVDRVVTLARAAGKFVALDPKPKRRLRFSDLDLITPNRREALQLADLEPEAGSPFPADQVCDRIHSRHTPRHLVVTLGEDGMLLSSGGKPLRTIPTAAREVFDVSGAGDTALAALTLALVAGSDLETAAHFANAAAGVVVGKLGTVAVTPAELLAYVSHSP